MMNTPKKSKRLVVALDLDTLKTSAQEDLDFSSWQHEQIELIQYSHTPPEAVSSRIKDADVVITNKVVLNQSHIQGAKKLALICVLATGVNNIDLQATKNNQICVKNAVNYGSDAVAEHTIGLMLALGTGLQYASRHIESDWPLSSGFCVMHYPRVQLSGKQLSIIGLGHIGIKVARLAQAFQMKVVRIRPKHQPASNQTIQPSLENRLLAPIETVPWQDGIAQADFLSLHLPLTAETQHLINQQVFLQMKDSAYLINTARGGLVQEADLLQALDNHLIAGAGLDVICQEPPNQGHPMLTPRDNLILTPHCAWLTQEARQAIVQITGQHLHDFLSTPLNRR